MVPIDSLNPATTVYRSKVKNPPDVMFYGSHFSLRSMMDTDSTDEERINCHNSRGHDLRCQAITNRHRATFSLTTR